MTRALLVATNRERLPQSVAPVGAAAVAAAARRRGHDVHLVDTCFAEDEDGLLARALETTRPQVVGLSLRNVDNLSFPEPGNGLPRLARLARLCRVHAPDALLIAGGPAFSLFPAEFRDALGLDGGVVGEGERAFADLLDSVGAGANGAPGIIRGDLHQDLDALPAPAFDLFDVARHLDEGGSIGVQTKRGCAFSCIYCTYPLLEGRHVRTRAPHRVVDEVQRLRERHGVDYVFFVDNAFNAPAEHAAGICRELVRREVDLHWTAYVVPDPCTRELLELMWRSGCRALDLGADSLSDAQLGRLGKRFDAAQVLRVARWCREIGIRFALSLVFGGPGETWTSVRETLENAVTSGATAVIAMPGLRLYPHTPLARFALSRGLIEPERIGLQPTSFVAAEVADGLASYLREIARRYGNWIVPGADVFDEEQLRRLSGAGIRGPLWTLLPPAHSPADGALKTPPPDARHAYVGGLEIRG